MEKSVTCKRMGDSLEYTSHVEKCMTVGKKVKNWNNGSNFAKWDILGKMGYTRKRGSDLEKWVTPPVSSVIRNVNSVYLR